MNNKVKFLRGTSSEYAAAEKDIDTIYFTTDDGKLYIGDKEVSDDGSITIDDTLSDTSENPVQNKIITSALNNKAESNHVHSYAGSSSEGGSATSAVKLDSSAGSSVNPVYFSEGKPVACTYTLGKSVPSDAVFTDTIYTLPKATISALGGVIPDGTSITVDEDGVISAVGGGEGGGVTIDSALSDTSENPVQNKVINSALNNKADKSKYGDTTINVGRKADSTVGDYSTAEGYGTTASGKYSHTEGVSTTASGKYSHAEGSNRNSVDATLSDRTVTISDVNYTITGSTAYGMNSHAEGAQSFAYGYSSHAEGIVTIASGFASHAEGNNTKASGNTSHAEGETTTASGDSSHAEGTRSIASNYASHAGGHYNAAMINGGAPNNTTGTAFVIGNGTGLTALSNAFSVMYTGVVKAKSTITASTTADYAEFFEWLDENPDEEDRVGYFVTIDGDKIRIATNEDDYILGVVSGEPFVLGNGDCDTWNGMFLRDEFRRTIYEPAPKMVEVLDSDGNPTGEFEEVEGEFEGTRPKLNPEYDHTQLYISRFDRKEWAPIGMLGVLAVRHDGTAVVNGYVTVNADGIATACDRKAENSYRVIKSNSDSVVEIIFR